MNGLEDENVRQSVQDKEEEATDDFSKKKSSFRYDEHPNKRLCLRYIEMYNNHVILYANEKKVSNFDDQSLLDSEIAHNFGKLKPSIISEKGEVYVRAKNIAHQIISRKEGYSSPDFNVLENGNDKEHCNGDEIRSNTEEEGEFFDSSTGLEANIQNDLLGELDTSDGPVQLRESGEIEGSHWSSIEKEIFFSSLARHSIHNLGAIKANLPMKSEKDILVYYKLLKEASTSNHKKVKRALKNTYKLTPIAFEMSENYIQIEDQFANLISEMELDKVERVSSQLYLKDRKSKVKDDNSLLKYASLYDLTKLIYWNQNILDENDGNENGECLKRLPPLSERAVYKLLENLIYRYTVDLVEQLILLKEKDGKKIKNMKHQKKRLVLEISLEDVQKVLLQKIAVTKNTTGKNNGVIYPLDRTVYFQNIEDRLKLNYRKERCHIDDQMAEFSSLFDQLEFQKHFVDCLDTDKCNNNTFFKHLESLNQAAVGNNASNDGLCEEVVQEQESPAGSTTQGDPKQNKLMKQGLIQEEVLTTEGATKEELTKNEALEQEVEWETYVDEDMEQHEIEKIMNETNKLEKRDMQISRRYQLMMLHFLNADS